MDDFSYLEVQSHDKEVLKNLATMGEYLKKLQTKMLEAEAAAEQAKKEYEHYANVVIPGEMRSCGIDSIGLSTGGVLHVKRNFYCQPNKNLDDRKVIVDWLRANGGDYIIEHNASVAAEDMDKLTADGIPFIENTSVNTQKLKSFIKDGIGVTTGVQKFTVDDIPKCVHFQEVSTVEIIP